MYKYMEWSKEELCKAEKELLMTINEVRKERKESGENGLDENQLDMIGKAIDGIKDIYEIRCMWHKHHTDIESSMSTTSSRV